MSEYYKATLELISGGEASKAFPTISQAEEWVKRNFDSEYHIGGYIEAIKGRYEDGSK